MATEIHSPRLLTVSQLVQEVGEWATKNFEEHWPELGMAEEIGEACHCILKHGQRIRGFEDIKFFQSQLADALADATIYLSHFTYLKNAYFVFPPMPEHSRISEIQTITKRQILSHVHLSLTSILTFESSDPEPSRANEPIYNGLCQKMIIALSYWANFYGLDLYKITMETWNEIVSKRNWKKNSKEGK